MRDLAWHSDLTPILWSGVRALPAANAAELGAPLGFERATFLELGSRKRPRVRLWAPREVEGRWVCPLHVGGRTRRPVLVPGDGAIGALIAAMRVRQCFVDEHGLVQPMGPMPDLEPVSGRGRAGKGHVWPGPVAMTAPVIDGELVVRGRRLRASVGEAVWVDRYWPEGGGARIRPSEIDGKPGRQFPTPRGLFDWMMIARSLASAMFEEDSGELGEPQVRAWAAVLDVVWSGIRSLATPGPLELPAPIAEETAIRRRFGRVHASRLAIWTPIQVGGRWVCPLLIEEQCQETLLVPGDGPVTALVNALRIVRMAFNEWWGREPREPTSTVPQMHLPPVPAEVTGPVVGRLWKGRGAEFRIGAPEVNPLGGVMKWFTQVFVPGRGVVSWPGTSPFWSLSLVGIRLEQIVHAPHVGDPDDQDGPGD